MKTKKTKKAGKPIPNAPVELNVAPAGERATRQVVARRAGKTFTDKIDPFKASAREGWFKRVTERLGELTPGEKEELLERLVRLAEEADARAAELVRAAEAENVSAASKEELSAARLEETPEVVKAAAEAFLTNPEMIAELEADFEKLGIVGEFVLALTLFVVTVSRLLHKPLGASVKASSSTGKSYVSEIVASLVPPEWLIQATSITMNALYYMAPGSLRHVVIVIGEVVQARAGDQSEVANLTLALRELLSRGRLVKCVTMKGEDGQLRTVQVEQEGPVAYAETTTQQDTHEENSNRMLSLCTDESPEQTRAIIEMQARQAAGKTATDEERAAIRQKYQAVHRLLKPVSVRVPYAERLTLDTGSVVARRTFPQLLAVIRAVALLRQRQKVANADGGIDADLADYKIARKVMRPVLRRTFAPVGDRAQKLLDEVQANPRPGGLFTRNDCLAWCGVSATEVQNRLKVLRDAGLIELAEGERGKVFRYRLVHGMAKTGSVVGLPSAKELRAMIEGENQ